MTKDEAVRKVIREETEYLKKIAGPYVEGIIAALENGTDWWHVIPRDKRPGAGRDWIDELGEKMKKAIEDAGKK